MSATDLAPARQLELLMPGGEWYRTVESYHDDHFLEPLFNGSGNFIACNALPDLMTPAGPETFVRCTSVQAIRWVPNH